MQISSIYPPITAQDITTLEEKLEFALPPQYASFLLQYNGGFPKPKVFWINDDQKSSILSFLFGITEKKHHDVYYNYDNFTFNDYPTGYLPIGRDPGGNYVCLGITPGNYGQVYFVDHETNLAHLMGKDLNSFLDGLYEGERQ